MEVNCLDKLVDYYHENKISHAYLIETNNLDKCFNDVIQVIKKIFCQENYSASCTKCNICNLVNQNYLPSLMVIEPMESTIKKEQILELKRNFSSIPVYTKDNVYVIKSAEKLTDSSANTMLKFIEEPEEHILGFFITNNVNNVISTIRSRCEIMKVVYDIHELNIDTLDTTENLELLDLAKEYLEKIEVEKKNSIMYNKDVLLSKLTEREEVKKFFKVLLIIYQEALQESLGLSSKFAKLKDFDFLLNLKTKEIIYRVNLITKFLEDITSNVNLELLLDKFIIELGDY